MFWYTASVFMIGLLMGLMGAVMLGPTVPLSPSVAVAWFIGVGAFGLGAGMARGMVCVNPPRPDEAADGHERV